MTIWERIASALSSLSIPMAASIYIVESGATLPDEFLTYMMVSDPPEQHVDNAENSRTYHVQVSYYNRAGLATGSIPDIEAAMISAGFTRSPGRELPYNDLTRHFGLAMEFWFYEEE